ncbi:hypothetical protein [Paracoccus sp. IB05]|uniref:hypothetical protein n=1 Tax=Paracoccus sp. IB05 TaxID=2779367 RepID=UPI0018E8B179|nr:hypothetical protein [Paracoccus sp. IB05]MBJ2150685.1 hypothetical protein [Paracoccus sp. IB05]
MTMFSQKTPFDLSAFLKVPASQETRQHIRLVKSQHQANARLSDDDAVIADRKLTLKKR